MILSEWLALSDQFTLLTLAKSAGMAESALNGSALGHRRRAFKTSKAYRRCGTGIGKSLVSPGRTRTPAGKLVTRVSTARIRRRPPQTRNGAALATPSYSLVPPGGFENSPRGEIGDAGVDGPNPALRPEEPGTVAVPGSINLWCPRADSNRRHPL